MKSKIILALRILAAAILLQTLYFKFSGAPESKFIFSALGVEPWGRWFAGISELIAAIFLLLPATQIVGAFLAIGIMLGAILSHLAVLGIVVQNDGGLLFGLAFVVLVSAIFVLLLQKTKVLSLYEQAKRLFRFQQKGV